jgi:GGDEF domain-containing protein
MQGRTLEAGGSLAATGVGPRRLALAVEALASAADANQKAPLRKTVERLTAVATKANGWRKAPLRSGPQDVLIGLANRSHLLDIGQAALAIEQAVLFVDVDRFKEVNDRGRARGGRPAARPAR